MTYAISAIETRYAGVVFRSRLEARWAAFFDLAEWRWTYEPLDLPGWIPDFVLCGFQPIFVEVKPFCDPKGQVVAETQSKIERAYQGPNEILLLGAAPGWETCFGGTVAFGLLAEFYPPEPPSQVGDIKFTGSDSRYWWESAVWQHGARDFFHEYGSYGYRMSGVHAGDHHLEMGGIYEFQSLWREAGNRVQWRRGS